MKNKSILFLFLYFFICSSIFTEDPIGQANKYFQMGKYNEAIQIYSKVKEVYPDTDWARISLLMIAKSQEKLGQVDAAIDEYKLLITKHKDTDFAEEAFFAIARLYASKGKTDNAIKAYESYIKNYPFGQFKSMALFNVASLYKEKKRYSKAIEKYQEILNNFPSELWFYSWAAINIGHIYMIKDNYDAAIESYQRVLNIEKNKFLYTLSLLYKGQAFIEKGDYKTAISIFKKILKTTSYFSEEALYGLAKAYYNATMIVMAKETMESLLQLYPKTIWKNEVNNKLKSIKKKLEEKKK